MELDVNQSKPFELFDQWFDEALGLDIKEPNAMVLSTVSSEGKPSSRVVLLKHHDTRGFCFYTNLTSYKGKQLEASPYVALNFFWEPIGKQIRIEGKAELVTAKEADDYFASRQRGSQIGAWASMQSSHLEARSIFEERIQQYETQYAGKDVPRPPFWSGFRVVPSKIEFWLSVEYRLHDRLVFERDDLGSDHWTSQKIYP